MTEEQIALARRVVACKGWRWMSGMLTGHGRLFERRGLLILQNGAPWVCVPDGQSAWFEPVAALPDLTDPATLGCLLALVRKAWRCPTVYVRQSTTRRVSDGVIAWEVCDLYLDAEACRALGVPREGSVGSWGHGSEAEALVAALESAP
jgi:hypothetical protein